MTMVFLMGTDLNLFLLVDGFRTVVVWETCEDEFLGVSFSVVDVIRCITVMGEDVAIAYNDLLCLIVGNRHHVGHPLLCGVLFPRMLVSRFARLVGTAGVSSVAGRARVGVAVSRVSRVGISRVGAGRVGAGRVGVSVGRLVSRLAGSVGRFAVDIDFLVGFGSVFLRLVRGVRVGVHIVIELVEDGLSVVTLEGGVIR